MSYSQLSKRASWTLFVVTLLLAGLAFAIIGFFSVFLGFIQHFIVPEQPWVFGRALTMGLAILIPALLLARFYFVIAAKPHSPRYAIWGWAASACYHAVMTWVFLQPMHGTIEASPSSLKIPLWTLCAAGALISLYLLVRLPRPPELPVKATAD